MAALIFGRPKGPFDDHGTGIWQPGLFGEVYKAHESLRLERTSDV